MAESQFGGEQPVNYEQKCPCVLVLDVSTSMQGPPMAQLNAGLQAFHADVKNSKDPATPNRLEIGLVTFGSTVSLLQEPALVHDFAMPTLEVQGSTKLVDGVRKGIQVVEDRKVFYKASKQDYYRPYVILVTDGEADADQDMPGLAAEIKEKVDKKGFTFWAFGTDGANMERLAQLAHPSAPAMKFASANFGEFFKWLSKSFSQITKSKEGAAVDLKPDNPTLFQHTV